MEFKKKLIGTTTSTNDVIKQAIDEGKPEGYVIRALRQTQGRGRNGHKWVSPAGSVYMSTFLRPQVPAEQLPTLSLLAGLVVYRMLADYYATHNKKIKLKWPNDVMIVEPINGKVAGILLETYGDAVIMGIGMNVNEPRNGESTDPAASYVTFVADIKHLDTQDFGDEFFRQFDGMYEQWLREGFAPFAEEFNAAMLLNERTIELLGANGTVLARGKMQGVDERGYLLIACEDGTLQAYPSGEIHTIG